MYSNYLPSSSIYSSDKIPTIPTTATCTTKANVPAAPSTYDRSPVFPKTVWESPKSNVQPYIDSKQPTGASNETRYFGGSAVDSLRSEIMKAPINKDLVKTKTTTNTTTTTTSTNTTTATPSTPPTTAIVPVTSSNKLLRNHPSSPSMSRRQKSRSLDGKYIHIISQHATYLDKN